MPANLTRLFITRLPSTKSSLEEQNCPFLFSFVHLCAFVCIYAFSSHLICNSCNRLFHVGRIPKSSGIEYMADTNKWHQFRTKRRKKTSSIFSCLVLSVCIYNDSCWIYFKGQGFPTLSMRAGMSASSISLNIGIASTMTFDITS